MARVRSYGFEWAGCRVAVETAETIEREESGLPCWEWPTGWDERTCSTDDADVHISVSVADARRAAGNARPPFDSHLHTYLHEGSLFEAGLADADPVFACGDGRLARFDRSFESGEVSIPRSAALAGLFPLLRPLDDLVVIHRSLFGGALAVRATAAVRDGEALVLLGDAPIADCSERPSSVWTGWLMLEPERAGIRVSPLPSTRVSGAPSPDSAHLLGLHVVEPMLDSMPVGVLDAEAGAAEILRFAFAPVVSAVRPERVLETATQLADRIPLMRVAAVGEDRFGWRRAQSALELGPPAGA